MKVVDMHCDTISEIWEQRHKNKNITLRKNDLHIDLEKMKVGDYWLQNFAMFVNLASNRDPLQSVIDLIDLFYLEIEENKNIIEVVKTYAEIERNQKNGKLSAMLTIEEGGVCKGDISVLRMLHRMGARMMTLTWNYENELAFPNQIPEDIDPCDFHTFHGVKEKGIIFLEEMERIGMIVDVSHLSDEGFYDVYQNTRKPFVASHSNARALCGHCRNLTDDMIRKLAERGGVTGLNYYAKFLDGTGREGEQVSRVKMIAEQASHIKNIGGIACIGLGSDFDGIGGDLEMNNCSKLPLLERELRRQGFHESEIEAVFYRNVLNLYRELL